MEGITTFSKAVRAKCVDCCCGQIAEVRNCTATTCPLHPFRNGHNPYSKRNMSDEQKEAAKERMRKYWDNKNNT